MVSGPRRDGISPHAVVKAAGRSADDHVGLPPAILNLIGTTHVMEIKSQSYYDMGCLKVLPAGSLIRKRPVRAPTVATPIKPSEPKRIKSLVIEDSDVEASGDSSGYVRRIMPDPISDSNKRKRVVNEVSSKDVSGLHMRMHPRNSVSYDGMQAVYASLCTAVTPAQYVKPTLLIASKTTVGQDVIVHSYYGLKLSDLPTPILGLKDNRPASTLQYAHTHASRRPRGEPPTCHNLGPLSYQCSKCDATMWYAKRIDKAKWAAHPTFSLCCQESKPRLS
ncbi:hypothetical protein Tco_0730179 [Tanacetum coccineum]|uniref:Uncharacterized protein n=1 Tax=Tanacetum coccineum TaxID=301880 RepID=A0ABQ4YU55_9ASTR